MVSDCVCISVSQGGTGNLSHVTPNTSLGFVQATPSRVLPSPTVNTREALGEHCPLATVQSLPWSVLATVICPRSFGCSSAFDSETPFLWFHLIQMWSWTCSRHQRSSRTRSTTRWCFMLRRGKLNLHRQNMVNTLFVDVNTHPFSPTLQNWSTLRLICCFWALLGSTYCLCETVFVVHSDTSLIPVGFWAVSFE